jgi:tetratricopeptide (TPR) repeat protein
MQQESGHPTGGPARNGQLEGHLGDRLDGWKAIAGHLRRDIRTVQRWEMSEGLPIHRLEHRQRATAYAFTGELDEWMAKREPAGPHRDSPAPAAEAGSRTRQVFLVLVILAGLAVAGVLAFRALVVPGRGGPTGDTQDPEAYAAFAEGSALYASRQYRDAAIALERAVSRDPSYGLAWAWLSKTYGRLSQPMWAGGEASSDRAIETAERAVQLVPDLSEAHIALALAARSMGDVNRWRAAAQRAIDLDARAAEAIALLGDSYSAYVYACNRNQDPTLAESYYRRAMEIKPNLVTAASNRGHNLRRMGRYTECVDLMNRTTRAFPDETPLIAERGACRLLAGDVAGAMEDILPLRNNPKIAPAGALVYLGLLELKIGRTEEGVGDLEAVLGLDRSARAEMVVAETYALTGEVGRAATHLQRAFDLDPSCVGVVDAGMAFASIRHTDAVKSLLARYGVR